jgi:hypothetical protein
MTQQLLRVVNEKEIERRPAKKEGRTCPLADLVRLMAEAPMGQNELLLP